MRWQTPNSILVFSTLRSSYGFLVNLPPPHIIALGSRETQAKASQYISFIVFLLFFYFFLFLFLFCSLTIISLLVRKMTMQLQIHSNEYHHHENENEQPLHLTLSRTPNHDEQRLDSAGAWRCRCGVR